jgi:hypothetical protein
LRWKQGVVLLGAVAACRDWKSLEDEALACLAGCRDAGESGADAGPPGACVNDACALHHNRPESDVVWTRSFRSGAAAASQIAITSSGCFIDVLTAFDSVTELDVLELDGGSRHLGATFQVLADAGIGLAARGGTLAAVWNADPHGVLQLFDSQGDAGRSFGLPFAPALVQVGPCGDDVFVVGLTSTDIASQRVQSLAQSAGPAWNCATAPWLGSLLAFGPSFLVAGSTDGSCTINGTPISQGVGFLAPIDDAGTGVGSASGLEAGVGGSGVFYAFQIGASASGELHRLDVANGFPGFPHPVIVWNGLDGGTTTPVSVVVHPSQPVAYLVLATDATLEVAPANGSGNPVAVVGSGAVVVKLTDTTSNVNIAWVHPIDGVRPTGATLVGDQLLVAGTCAELASSLCPDPHAVWIVSISP